MDYGLPLLFLIVILIITLLFLFSSKRRLFVQHLPAEIQNTRVLTFQPEPLITDPTPQCYRTDNELSESEETAPDLYNLTKTDFLNLHTNAVIRKVAENSITQYGVGSCGPRGFYGTIDIHLELENRLAEFFGVEEAILYSYGFSTIASAIGAYCRQLDVIFCDEFIGLASQQGCTAAKSKVEYYDHNDMEDLERRLKYYSTDDRRLLRKFIIVEGISASSGTVCNLPKIMELHQKYGVRIFLDESLSIGALGKTGRGVTELYGVDRDDIDMIMGSLEGPICSIGGFCVGTSFVLEHQRLSGLGYCFSASLPPFLSQVAITTLEFFEKDPTMFKKLKNISIQFHKKFHCLTNYEMISDPISPIKVFTHISKNAVMAKRFRRYCGRNNILLVQNEDKLILNVNLGLTDSDIERIIGIFDEAVLDYY